MDQVFVGDVLDRLAEAGVDGLLFGGWAEEIFGLCPPRPHGDIDLLWRAESFDLLTAPSGFSEIAAKRFAHKRAFLFREMMVEITRVERDGDESVTWFWGDVRYVWLHPLNETYLLANRPCRAVSPANLQRYRTLHRTTEPWRWRDPASLVRASVRSAVLSTR